MKHLIRPIPVLCMLLLFLGGLCLLLRSSQWWLPKLAPVLLDRIGVHVASTGRTEGGRWWLEGLHYQEENGLFLQIDRVECPNLWQYLRFRWLEPFPIEAAKIELSEVTFRTSASGAGERTVEEKIDLPDLIGQVDGVLTQIQPWLPPVKVGRFHLLGSDSKHLAQMVDLEFSGRDVAASIFSTGLETPLVVSLSFQPRAWLFRANHFQKSLEARLALRRYAGELSLEGKFTHRGDSILIQSGWQDAGLLPNSAILQTSGLTIPPEILEQLGDRSVGQAHILEAELSWDGQRYTGEMVIEADAQWQEHRSKAQGRVKLEGDFRQLHIRDAVLALPELADFQASGHINYQDSYLNFNYNGTIRPGLAVALGAPDWLRESLQVEGLVEGPISEPGWSLAWRAPAVHPVGMKMFEATGRLAGSGARPAQLEAELQRDGETIALALELTKINAELFEGRLEAFSWEAVGQTGLRLSEPGLVSLPLKTDWSLRFEQALIESLVISAPDAHWSLEKARAGPLRIRGEGFAINGLESWIDQEIAPCEIRTADLTVRRISPYLEGQLDLSLVASIEGFGGLGIDLKGLRLGDRAEMEALCVTHEDKLVCTAAASLPFQLIWDESGQGVSSRFSNHEPIELLLEVEPSQSLADKIQHLTGLGIDSAHLGLNLSGTVDEPKGQLFVTSSAIRLDNLAVMDDNWPQLPDLQEIELEASLEGRRLHLTRLKAKVRDGLIEGTGSWPIHTWQELIQGSPQDWKAAFQRGSIQLDASNWALEDWTPYLLAILRRSGVISGSLAYGPESGLTGTLKLSDLGLRPTQNLPSVDSISGLLRLNGPKLVLEESGARVGGSQVSVRGQIDLESWPKIGGELLIEGDNVPVVRRADMILRSDLKLALRQEPTSLAPRLEGRLDLRSSTMLVEFDPLSPTVRSGPVPKPPFFAIEESPFDQWALNLRIEGERFLRVRSPYFQAILSAGLDLRGHLGEPLLLGSIRLAEGSLSFPGAKMRMDRGEAFIEYVQPDALQLDLLGTARTGTHIITMAVSGSAADPQIQFDATPSMPNASILRLLSTGSTKGGGVGTVGLYLGRGLLGGGGMNQSLADRFTLDLGEETSRSGKKTMGVRYDVGEDVYLKGEYDVYDTYNADVLWTLFEE